MVERFPISLGWGADKNGDAVWAKDYDALAVSQAAFAAEHMRHGLAFEARIRELEAALREIGEEIAAHGCDGPFEEVCINAERSPEDWCRYCRMGATITNILPYSCSPLS